jgi:tubulin monoglycylase TTLL3/8
MVWYGFFPNSYVLLCVCLCLCVSGGYPCVRQALQARGWHYNEDAQSPYFDLKWALRSMDIDRDQLQPWQWTNHFLKNSAVTTKVGLLRSLPAAKWIADVSIDDIIPRGTHS